MGLPAVSACHGRQKSGGQVKRRAADDRVHRKPQNLRRYRIEYCVQNRAEQRRDKEPPALFRKRPKHARSCNLSMFHSMLPNISSQSASTQNGERSGFRRTFAKAHADSVYYARLRLCRAHPAISSVFLCGKPPPPAFSGRKTGAQNRLRPAWVPETAGSAPFLPVVSAAAGRIRPLRPLRSARVSPPCGARRKCDSPRRRRTFSGVSPPGCALHSSPEPRRTGLPLQPRRRHARIRAPSALRRHCGIRTRLARSAPFPLQSGLACARKSGRRRLKRAPGHGAARKGPRDTPPCPSCR